MAIIVKITTDEVENYFNLEKFSVGRVEGGGVWIKWSDEDHKKFYVGELADGLIEALEVFTVFDVGGGN